MLFAELVATSATVRATRSRLAKIDAIAGALMAMGADEVEIGVKYLSGEPRQEKTGLGYATVGRIRVPATPAPPQLTLRDVDTALENIAVLRGPGSQTQRNDLWRALLALATGAEQDYLRGLVLRNVRQGALEGVVIEAVARAADCPADEVRRATMVSGRIEEVAAAALGGGCDALSAFALEVFRPVLPMLAATAEDVGTAMGKTGTAAVEYKVDGARIQVHRRGDEVRVYTRNLNEITDRVPEVVIAVRSLAVDSLILDGEAIAQRADGSPHRFQVTMSRFGTQEEGHASGPALTPFFFDCLHLDGADLLDRPTGERFAAMAEVVPSAMLVPRIETDDPAAAEAFNADALAAGHEGVMVKSLAAGYEAGRRGASWLKVKPAHTLDLVVLAVEWGSGRRSGWLSNLHLGARDPAGGFVMLGKTFKGMTDEMLRWQTERFLELETHREGHVLHLRPEQVVEIAFDGVQGSSRYPGGMALRFARVKAYRHDKTAAEADTVDTVRAIYERRG